MLRALQVIGVGLVVSSVWGCGGESAPPPGGGAAGGAAGQAVGVAPLDMMDAKPAGAGQQAGGQGAAAGMGAAGDATASAAGAPAQAAGPATSGEELLIFLPPTLKTAMGVNFTAMAMKANPLGLQLLNQLQPVTEILTRAGLTTDQVEHLWAGSNAASGDLVLCVRAKGKPDMAAILKRLGAAPSAEKIGKATVHDLAGHPTNKNSVAVIDGRTFLIGRHSTLVAALKNPPPGAVRWGLETLNLAQTAYWLAGDDSVVDRQVHGGSLAVLRTRPGTGAPAGQFLKPRGVAVGLNAGASPSDGESQGGATSPMPGVPMPGAAPMSPMGDPTGTSPGQTGEGGPGVSLTVGMSFTSEALASVAEVKIGDVVKLVQQAGQAPQDGQGPPGANAGAGGAAAYSAAGQPMPMPMPGQDGVQGAGAGRAQGPNAKAARPMPMPMPMPGQSGVPGAAGGHAQGGVNSPPMGNDPMAPMQATAGGGQTAPPGPNDFQIVPTVTREKEKIRLTINVSDGATPFVVNAFGDLLQIAGASAINDGIFEGTLVSLSRGVKQWHNPGGTPTGKADTSLSGVAQNLKQLLTAKPGSVSGVLQGVKRVGDLPVRSGYSWMVDVLPFVGREDLHARFDFSKSWSDPENFHHATTVIPEFLNPQDPRARWRGFPFQGLGLTHFVGMSGVEDRNMIAAALDRSDPRAGIFGYDSIAKMSEITDGAAQTIMLIGSGRNIAAPWVQGGGATIRGARAPYFDHLSGFGSAGLPKPGTYVLFADGSTRVISADINPEVFKAMCTIHGAEQIDLAKQLTQN